MSREVWCIMEHRAGRVDPDSLQLFAAARKLDVSAWPRVTALKMVVLPVRGRPKMPMANGSFLG